MRASEYTDGRTSTEVCAACCKEELWRGLVDLKIASVEKSCI